ncbi:MAG: helix-turn-helix transcriptional regulator [Methylococcales bacterium]|nr:helix-turn-helix transcriptional regulator [Methylococcales bacterium]
MTCNWRSFSKNVNPIITIITKRWGSCASTIEDIPPRVEYTLTKLAESLKPLFEAIVNWSDEHTDEIYNARLEYDQTNHKTATG